MKSLYNFKEQQKNCGETTKIILCFIFTLTIITTNLSAQKRLPFEVGETLNYSVWYNFIKAGHSSMKLVSVDTVNEVSAFYAVSKTRSGNFLDRIFKIRDSFESWIDRDELFSHKFKKDIREGRYKKKYSVVFNYSDSLAISGDDTTEINQPIHDALSIFYYVRAESLWVDRVLPLNHFDNNKFRPYNIIVNRQENVSVPAGKFKCFVLKPYTEKGSLFKYKGQVTIYISDDQYRLPVMIESEATIGSMLMKLESKTYDN